MAVCAHHIGKICEIPVGDDTDQQRLLVGGNTHCKIS